MTIADSPRSTITPQNSWLWFSVAAGPLAWALHLTAIYFIVSVFCGSGESTVKWLAFGASVVLAAPVVLGLFAGSRSLSRKDAFAEPDYRLAAVNWLSHAALYLNILFLTAIVVQLIPVVMLGAC